MNGPPELPPEPIPYYDDGTVRILHGDAREQMATLDAASIEAVVCDPPYGLSREPDVAEVLRHWLAGDDYHHGGGGFMGRTWDSFVPGPSVWREAFRVLKPGGWLLAFGGTRTYDLLSIAIRMAGFELRDSIAEFGPLAWIHGQGFPKSKACLKPAWEPVIVARKPGSSVLQIDATRIGTDWSTDPTRRGWQGRSLSHEGGAVRFVDHNKEASQPHVSGRWPANVLLSHSEGCQPVGVREVRAHWGQPTERTTSARYSGTAYNNGQVGGNKEDKPIGYADPDGTETVEAWECDPDCPVFLLDQQSGERTSATGTSFRDSHIYGERSHGRTNARHHDYGGASRFFYTAKAGPTERVTVDGEQHPTVKPLTLMRWLVRLVTPSGGTVLDPFCGSGSTLVAAVMEGFRAVGIEADERWCRGAAKRVTEIPPIQEALAL